MKKKLVVFSFIIMIFFFAITFTSCWWQSTPDISHLSERFLDDNTKVKLWWDFKSRARPFDVLFSLQSATMTTIASDVNTNGVVTDVTPGEAYHWQIKGGNGSSSGVKTFEVPEN